MLRVQDLGLRVFLYMLQAGAVASRFFRLVLGQFSSLHLTGVSYYHWGLPGEDRET